MSLSKVFHVPESPSDTSDLPWGRWKKYLQYTDLNVPNNKRYFFYIEQKYKKKSYFPCTFTTCCSMTCKVLFVLQLKTKTEKDLLWKGPVIGVWSHKWIWSYLSRCRYLFLLPNAMKVNWILHEICEQTDLNLEGKEQEIKSDFQNKSKELFIHLFIL